MLHLLVWLVITITHNITISIIRSTIARQRTSP
jgi:hypothetical protein